MDKRFPIQYAQAAEKVRAELKGLGVDDEEDEVQVISEGIKETFNETTIQKTKDTNLEEVREEINPPAMDSSIEIEDLQNPQKSERTS